MLYQLVFAYEDNYVIESVVCLFELVKVMMFTFCYLFVEFVLINERSTNKNDIFQ